MTKSRPKKQVQDRSADQVAQLLFVEMQAQHTASKLSRKFNKSEWLFAMASALKAKEVL